MDSVLLSFEENAPVAYLTLNRPECHNAFDDQLIQRLLSALKQLATLDKIKVVVLQSVGKSFSAGADVRWMQRMAQADYATNLADAQQLAELMATLNSLNKPTLAAVQGPAFGGGVGLLACCDIVIASTSASFCLSEVKLGLIPAVISPYVIAKIGVSAARRYFNTAERFDAAEAYRLQLIHQPVKPQQLTAAVNAQVKQLLLNSPAAMAANKELIAEVAKQAITSELGAYTAASIAKIRVSAEAQEGLQAFLNKRQPAWISE